MPETPCAFPALPIRQWRFAAPAHCGSSNAERGAALLIKWGLPLMTFNLLYMVHNYIHVLFKVSYVSILSIRLWCRPPLNSESSQISTIETTSSSDIIRCPYGDHVTVTVLLCESCGSLIPNHGTANSSDPICDNSFISAAADDDTNRVSTASNSFLPQVSRNPDSLQNRPSRCRNPQPHNLWLQDGSWVSPCNQIRHGRLLWLLLS